MVLDLAIRVKTLEHALIARDREILDLKATLAERDAEIKGLKGAIFELTCMLSGLTEKIAKLERQLNANSSNSSKPPSTDPPWRTPRTVKGSGKKKKGGQKGHAGIARELVPVEEVDEVIACKPTDICACGGVVHVDELDYERKQVFELPPIKPHITEYQIFKGCCSNCSGMLRGTLPTGTPPGILGPRALATIALLTGKFHLSKRDVEELFCDYFGLSICAATVCNAEQRMSNALKAAYDEVVEDIKQAPVLHADETGHKVAGKRAWMWIVLSSMYAVFFARASRTKKVAQEILGTNFSGILISDRYNAYLWVNKRQLCWAHLIRDFVKLQDAGGIAAEFADKMLGFVKEMFTLWHGFKANNITRAELQEQMLPIRIEIENLLEKGKNEPLPEVLCKQLCKLKSALWVFVDNAGVEPTNNEAERMIRQYVIWRKTSFGTQSQKGNAFVERILTTIATCKRQNRKVFEFLVEAMSAQHHGKSAPSLISAV